MLGGQLKYVSICTLHTDFERMVYQLLRPAAVRLDQKSNQLSWRSTRSIEISMQPVLLRHNCRCTAFPFESCRLPRLAGFNWVLGGQRQQNFSPTYQSQHHRPFRSDLFNLQGCSRKGQTLRRRMEGDGRRCTRVPLKSSTKVRMEREHENEGMLFDSERATTM